MADTVYAQLVSASGARFHTDEATINSIVAHVPINKLAFGALDTATLVEATAGLPVQQQTGATWQVQSNNANLATQTTVAAIQTAVELLDDAIVADDAAFTPATTKVLMAGFEFDDTSPDSVNEGDAGAARMSANRCIYVNIRDNAGNERGLNIDANGAIAVDTELPAAAALADSTANPTVPAVGAFGMVWSGSAWNRAKADASNADALATSATNNHLAVMSHNLMFNGTTYDRVRGDTTNGLDVDVTQVIPGTGATNLGKAIDTATGGTDTGVLALATRDDALSGLTPIEGDNVQLRVDANGALWVIVSGTVTVGSHAVTNAGVFAVQVDGAALTALQLIDDPVFADDAAFTLASSKVMMAGAIRDDALGTLTAVEGDAVPLRVSSTGALHVTGGGGGTEYTEDEATANPIIGAAVMMERDDALSALTPIEGDWASLRCDANGALWTALNSVIPGTAATNLGKAEDAGHTSADTGIYVLAVRDDSPAAHSGTDGDYESLHVSAEGGLWTTPTGSASGGLTTFRSIDLDESEEEVKATAGTVYHIAAFNRTAAPLYLKLYNDTAANVSVGSSTPTHTYVIPGNADSDGAGFILSVPSGIAFSTAICAAVTTGVADADTGAPGANEAVVNIQYK